jgi:hypothetical protein
MHLQEMIMPTDKLSQLNLTLEENVIAEHEAPFLVIALLIV